MRFCRPASLASDDLKRDRKCFYEDSYCLLSLWEGFTSIGEELECIFIQKRKDEKETMV